MDIRKYILAGDMAKARAELIGEIKRRPADQAVRVLLVKVMCFLGEWDKAVNHLQILTTQDPSAAPGVEIFRNQILGAKQREQTLSGRRTPDLLPLNPGLSERWAAYLQDLNARRQTSARRILDEIANTASSISGIRSNVPFADFRDTDDRFFAGFEAIVHDRYVWIPMDAVRELAVSPPADLMDLLWASCRFTLWDGLTLHCYLPVLYPGSHAHENPDIRMGRATDWIDVGENLVQAAGQHVFALGDQDIPLLELGEVIFNPPRPTGPGDDHD